MFSKYSIKRPVTTVMVILIVILTGTLALMGLKLDLMPKVDIPIAIVSTSYTGAGPKEIETLITKPMEEVLGTVSNVSTISSTSSSGNSIVIIEFEDGTDLDLAAIDMREKVDMIKRMLPDDANDPIILKIDISSISSMQVGITSDKLDLTELNILIDEKIVSRLERIEGVASVSLAGGIENEIEIIISPEKMQGYGISTSQIAQILFSENTNYPTGKISQGDTKLQVRSVGEFKSIEDIRNLPITTSTGAVIYMSDIATVNQVEKEMESYAIINGKPGIMLTIQKQSNANTVDISDKVNAEIVKIQKDYNNITINMLTDTSKYIKLSVKNVINTAIQSALMAILVLFIFLRNPKTALIIGISIPTSVIATFALMYVSGMTMNLISMGGITIGIGMLVDNSVVVLENIFKHWKAGMDSKTAAETGASEVAMAVTASTLTTVAVFIPLMFISGTIGQLFKDLSLTVSFALFASLIVSLTFVPMACSQILKNKKNPRKGLLTNLLEAWGRGLDNIDRFYKNTLSWSLKNKKKVIFIVLIIFASTLALIPIMGVDFMPTMDEGSALIKIELPKGTVIEETKKAVAEVLNKIDGIEEIDLIYLNIGGGGLSLTDSSTDTANINVNLVGKDKRTRSTQEVVEEMRIKLLNTAGAKITVEPSGSAMGQMGSSNITIELVGEDTDILKSIGEDMIKLVSQIDGVREVVSSAEDSIPEANIIINRAKASTYGINAATIANAVNTAVTGSVATQYKVNGTEIDVRIRQNKETTKYINDIKNIIITSPRGIAVPLTELADIQHSDSSLSITRKNQHRYITVDANIIDRDINSVKKDLQLKLDEYVFPDGYTYQFTGILENMTESYNSLMIILIVAVLLVYMIMASQFESLIYPFIVIFSIPLAITGGILGLFITGNTISVTAFMGFIMLVGMVVNNAIVLVDYTNQLMGKGMKCNEALIEAGPSRLRPILMTTLTTILGLIPMALATNEGTEMQQPLAISVIFGLAISTIVTLIFIPVLYSIIDKLRLRNIVANKN